jgi:hypothetical protein
MPITERWARTDDQIRLLNAAKIRGGLCAAYGRQLLDGEAVFFERFGAGTALLRQHGMMRPRPYNFAPVGAECASPELLAHTEARKPEPCATCGRGVVYPQARPGRRWVSCSQQSALHASHQVATRIASSSPPSVQAPPTEFRSRQSPRR